MMIKADILSKSDLEKEAQLFLEQYSLESLSNVTILDLESIVEFDLGLSIDYQQLDENGNLLGMTIFKDSSLPIINENR